MRPALAILAATAIAFITPAADDAAVADLVARAQAAFEDGELRWAAGDRDAAVEAFDRSHALLLDADQAAMGRHADRFVRIYARYRVERARYDGERFHVPPDDATTATREAFGDVPLSAEQIAYFVDVMVTRNHGFLERSFDRALRYIPMIRDEFDRAGVPPALAYMALVESGFRERPTSSAGAHGLWQFMPATARRFGLRVNATVDDREDPVRATRAAAAYLRTLHAEFEDWPLAVAAYNCGEGRVRRALARTGASSFWELADRDALPRETIQYVPKIVAVTLIARDPTRHGFRGATPGADTTR